MPNFFKRGAVDLDAAGGNALAARATRTSVWAATNATEVFMPWEVTSYDNGGFFNAAAPTRLTIPEAGVYLVGFGLRYAHNTSNRRSAWVRVNGTNPRLQDTRQAVAQSGVPTSLGVSELLSLAAGDYVELALYQDSGANLNVEQFADLSPALFISKQ